MSEVQDVTNTTEATVSQPVTTEDPTVIPENTVKDEAAPTTEAPATESTPQEATADDQLKDEAAAAAEEKDEATPAEKPVEPISEGQLSYKGPGLLKSLIPSKKEVWLTDDTATPQELNSYLRGEKPEISHPVVAWASQTGKGLLFLNKKGDTNRKQPGHVLALYDATDLKKQNPHEITFKIGSHEHTLKAASDAERDGWYMSIEKAIEMGIVSKDEIHESEGYKEELEKLNKPNVTAAVASAASKRSQSQPKKSTEADGAKTETGVDDKKKNKSRSTSRGVLTRFKGKKDEPETKEEKTIDTEEAKPDEEHKTEEAAAAGAATTVVAAGIVAPAEANSAEDKQDSTDAPVDAGKTEEKTKPAKRGSIFGKMAGWGGVKSPSKEKDAELKPEVPPKDGAVSEEPPVLPETATTEQTDAEAEANKIESNAETETAKENQKDEVLTPSKEKSGFLSGFLPKRTRSVSPSTNLIKSESEAPKEASEEPAKTEEATATAVASESANKVEEPAKTETTTANKRESVFGSLQRRASKAMSGMRGQKKENVAPASETKEEPTEVASEVEKPTVNGEVEPASSEQPQTIGDVVPSAISVGQTEQPPTVTASA